MKRTLLLGGAFVAVMAMYAPQAHASAPVISGISSSTIATTASVRFTTDIPANGLLQVGTTTAYGTTLLDSAASTTHAYALTMLLASTTYHFRVSATDASSTASTTSSDYTFLTGALDVTPPVITLLASTTASSTFSVAYGTDEPSTSTFRYGTTTSYGTTLVDGLLPSHSYGVSGLTPGTTYHFLFTATDVSGNTASTTDATFTTLPAPTISGLASTTNATSTTVTFTTNVPSDVAFQFGTSTSYGSTIVDAATTTHVFSYSNLTPSTTYHFRLVVANSSTGASTTTPDYTARTIADVIPPVLSAAAISSTDTLVVLDWVTDKYSTSYVRLGTTTSYTIASSSPTFYIGHAIYIFNLTPSTLYHVIYSSTDAYGNTATSSDMTFTTYASPVASVPPTQASAPVYGGSTFHGSSIISPVVKTVPAPTVSSAVTPSNSMTIYMKDLKLGVTNADVLSLQKFLNTHGAVIATSGVGSPGNESTYFGALTKKALMSYQKAHGIVPASGYFGSLTRAYVGAHP